jgi:hypothetical protein
VDSRKNIQMKIPKSWDDITMGNLAAYLKMSNGKPRLVEDDPAVLTERVAVLLGITIDEAKKIPIAEVNQITRVFSKLPTRLMLSFNLKGKRYKAVIDARKLNGEKYTAIKLAQSRDPYETIPQILFIVSEQRKFGFRKKFPLIGWRTIEPQPEDIEQAIEDFKQLPVSIGWPMASFFLRTSKELREYLKEFSLKGLDRMTEQMQNLQADLESDTDL